jgi:hypothetical protein
MPVFDVSNFMQAIASVMGIYNQVDMTFAQVQNSYEQIRQQVEMVKGLDFENIDFSQLGSVVRYLTDPVKNARALIERNINLIRETKNTIAHKTVNVAGVNYSLGSLLGFEEGSEGRTLLDMPKNIAGHIADTGEKLARQFMESLSLEQIEAIRRRYDMTPENYALMKMTDEVLDKTVTELFVNGSEEHVQAVLKEVSENAAVISKLTESAGESVVSNVQAATKGIEMMITGLGDLQNEVSKVAGFLAQQEIAKKAREEIENAGRELAAQLETHVEKAVSRIPLGYFTPAGEQ